MRSVNTKRSVTLILVLLMLCVSIFSACGKKGGLYLPTDPEPIAPSEEVKPNSVTAEESNDSKKKPANQE